MPKDRWYGFGLRWPTQFSLKRIKGEFKQTLCPENTHFLEFWSSSSRNSTHLVNDT